MFHFCTLNFFLVCSEHFCICMYFSFIYKQNRYCNIPKWIWIQFKSKLTWKIVTESNSEMCILVPWSNFVSLQADKNVPLAAPNENQAPTQTIGWVWHWHVRPLKQTDQCFERNLLHLPIDIITLFAHLKVCTADSDYPRNRPGKDCKFKQM